MQYHIVVSVGSLSTLPYFARWWIATARSKSRGSINKSGHLGSSLWTAREWTIFSTLCMSETSWLGANWCTISSRQYVHQGKAFRGDSLSLNVMLANQSSFFFYLVNCQTAYLIRISWISLNVCMICNQYLPQTLRMHFSVCILIRYIKMRHTWS